MSQVKGRHFRVFVEAHKLTDLSAARVEIDRVASCPQDSLSLCLFQSLWIERTTLILTHPLPGISRWFEVDKRELVSQ